VPFFDTIVAPITGSQPAAVAWVRLSGPEAWAIASQVFSPWPGSVEPRRALYGKFSNGDDGLALPFAEGQSYTGEQTAELSLHGSLQSVASLVERCIAAGARIARPGEFTERAFLNGRLDLLQAEGVRDSIEAVTEAQLRQASLHREGHLSRKVQAIRNELIGCLAIVEATTDFSEEIGDLDHDLLASRIEASIRQIQTLLSTAKSGELIRRGLRIAIAGLPNAGKSSLLNALLQKDRAIVTPIAGTTRDYVSESAVVGGALAVLIDTAGLRETADVVEFEGVSRARKIISQSDAVWYVFDALAGWTEADAEEFAAIPADRSKLRIANKIDLVSHKGIGDVAISASTGQGIEALHQWVAQLVQVERAMEEPFVAPRHAPLLRSAESALQEVVTGLRHAMPSDLASVGLQAAIHDLGEITGETASSELLDRIFRDFCLGK
jgi:tRNA modification GTPase